MSEERLEKALEALRNEPVAADELAAARTRVWSRLAGSSVVCGEFRAEFRQYLEGGLLQSRRLLLEDHLGRCTECRREFAVLKGERKVFQMPVRRIAFWPQWRAWAVAASLVLLALYLGRGRIDSLLAPGGPRATVQSVSGELYRVPQGVLAAGAAVGEGDVLRTGPGSHAVLRLADGSGVEVNERSELYVTAAWTGQTIHLQRGDVIVQAAHQRHGRLRVQTRDSLASVKGTVFAVSAGMVGSIVSVIEGSVEVTQPGSERLLHPGEQAVSNPALQDVTVRDAVSWSQDSQKYLALLAEFSKLEKKIAAIPEPALRTQSALLPYIPANAVVYAAFPNIGGTIGRAVELAEQQAEESEVFREWWNSTDGKELRAMAERIASVTPMFGNEIVFVLAKPAAAGRGPIPVLLAEVQPGRQQSLNQALEALAQGKNGMHAGIHYVADRILILSDSREHVEWVIANAGRGAAEPFAADIARHYQRGVGWLLALNVDAVKAAHAAQSDASHSAALEATGAAGMKYIFFEQRTAAGGDENEATFLFHGPRTGLASWLAPGGTSGAAEYISSDAVFAFSASTREPRQLFEEFSSQVSRLQPNFDSHLREIESKLGITVADDIAGALGTDFAIAVERPSIPVPGWVAAAAVNNPAVLDATIRKLVDAFNNEMKPENQQNRLVLAQQTAGGRVWNTLKPASGIVTLTWTYDRGYLLASSDQALILRAIATRDGGFPLIWSPAFQGQMPGASGIHPSGFVWLNARGALQGLASLVSNPGLQKLMSDRDPVLVILNGETEQIRAASRTRLTSLLLDAMFLGTAGDGGKAKPNTSHDATSH